MRQVILCMYSICCTLCDLVVTTEFRSNILILRRGVASGCMRGLILCLIPDLRIQLVVTVWIFDLCIQVVIRSGGDFYFCPVNKIS